MNYSTLKENEVHIHELADPFERISFQFLPDQILWDRSANFVNIPIVGRNNSKKQLTGGEDRVTFTLEFNGLFEDDKRHCIQRLKFLQSLAVTNGFAGPARNVKIAWGDVFRFNVWVVKSVKGVYSNFSGLGNMNPMRVVVDVEFELDPTENSKMLDVRGIYINDILPVRSINDSGSNTNVA